MASSKRFTLAVVALIICQASAQLLLLHRLDEFNWWMMEIFANFIRTTAILKRCKAVSEFISLYVTSEQGMLRRGVALL